MGIQDVDCVRGRIVIFHEILSIATWGLLAMAGIWDLEKKEIPTLLLFGLSLIAVLNFGSISFGEKLYCLIMIFFLGSGGGALVKCGKLGGGDLWLLVCFVFIWPMNVFWKSLSVAGIVLCTVAMGLWLVTGNEKMQLPFVPFLLLGYWM